MNENATEKREITLQAAEKLFEANGFHATGVDAIADKAGVTKRTLYKYFGSKEKLIEAVLRRHQNQMMDRVRTQMSDVKEKGGQRLLACFDLYQKWFSQPHFAGCIFIKTLNEFQRCSKRLSAIASVAKLEHRNYLVELAEASGAADPELLADQLQLILEGSVVVAQCDRENASIRVARQLAEQLILQALNC